MKLAGALVLLGAALLLTSGGDCGICPVIEKDVDLFLFGTSKDYVDYVKQYKDNPEVLESTEKIKQCVDSTLTDEDKKNAAAVIEKVKANPLC
ncbi:major allergen I polypeptide chain 1-like [Rattus rattus]|uniref:major allergen I polypeptide chain 1-like n=1 Tax=Rattus rattus TaxID=10117 RepID=UPI0013F35BDE|nr:major allergen I polypeptide chain 1-like [Rattus rattus]